MKVNWESLFKSHIRERGYDYHADNRVRIISADEHKIEACVDGSDVYEIEIDVDAGNIINMECDCPYAAGGNNCKHMAAVLYEFFSEENSNKPESDHLTRLIQEKEMLREDIQQLLSKIPDEEKQILLTNLLINDSELRNTLKLKYDYILDAKQLLALRQEIDDIVDENCYHGYIDWNHAYDFCCSLKCFLEDRVEFIVDKGALKPAFELTNKIFMLIGSIDMDDSDGGSVMVAAKCYSIWKTIYQKADIDAKKRIKNWFLSYKEGRLLDWIEGYLLEFRNTELASPEELLVAMNEIDSMIEARGDSNDCGYMYSINEGRISLIDKRIDYMRRLGMSQPEIDDYCDKHMQFYAVRIRKLEEYIEAKAYGTAIDLLIKSKQLDSNDKALLTQHSDKLLELYKLTGSNEDYFVELQYNLLHCTQSDVNKFRELKSLYREKKINGWENIADLIIEKNRGSYVVYDFFIEESKFEQLMDDIEEDTNVYILDKYLKILSKEVPERVIHIYATYIKESMEQACDRNAYRSIVKYLKTMSFSEAGRVKAEEIANDLKMEYRRRPAMLDELMKIGF
ncbi:MAG: hypothetical protein E7272_07110 [Pseudobutyrivibrio ruminis]|uniref:SWIM-type domain-containing protein n=1 Tax=Pseudobutyrivibrio ruminis TaxID=46206 RepID=A0A927U7B2_9FIRM|nr:hypothetical protein [Pseudobutyrivibrio ruminis]